jgi:oligopeptide transport system substrate-binding protein
MKRIFLCVLLLGVFGSAFAQWNNPHKAHHDQNIRYGAFAGPPKTLDPARSYTADEALFTGQIYEPPLQYDYLKRPLELVPLTATRMPVVTYYDAKGVELPKNTDPKKIAYSLYDIEIKPGMFFQPHPALAKDEKGNYRYHHLNEKDLKSIYTLNDFKYQGTREVTADDYVYEIKRLAHPALQSPIFGVMIEYIAGLANYEKTLEKSINEKDKNTFLDLRNFPLEGANVISRYHYQIKIKGIYTEFNYWLAMPFFAPIPWEADYFYSQPGMKDKNLTLDWFPIGTGPYLLSENNPNKEMVLERNPNFRGEKHPSQGSDEDKAKGYLDNAGKTMPFIDKFIFSLDKESIPRWYKFLQGYYDTSGVSADSFDQAIRIDENGKPIVSPELQQKGIRLQTAVAPSIFISALICKTTSSAVTAKNTEN